MPPFWFLNGLRVGAKEYRKVMRNAAKPWLDTTFPWGIYIRQQDSTPGHRANVTRRWSKKHLAVIALLPYRLRQPSSPDLLSQTTGSGAPWSPRPVPPPLHTHSSMDHMNASVKREWAYIYSSHMIKVCRLRLEVMAVEDERHSDK